MAKTKYHDQNNIADSKLTWKKSGKKCTGEAWSKSAPSAAEVAAVARDLKVALPADYVKFLTTVNGGIPSKLKFACRGENTITVFYELADLTPEIEHFRSELDLPAEFVPVALAEEDIVVLKGDQVFLWSMIESGFDPDRVTALADSFEGFLERLQSKLVKPKYDEFMDAMNSQDLDAMQRMLDEGINIDGDGDEDTALEIAIRGEEWKSVEFLLAAGASHDFPIGDSAEEEFRDSLEGERDLLKTYRNPQDEGALESRATIEFLEQLLQRFFA